MQFQIGHVIGKNIKRGCRHFLHFWPIVLILTLLFGASYYAMDHDWTTYKNIVMVVLCLLILLLCGKPMNAVYGLMGTSGSIRLFFVNFILITLLFAGVYYYAFFKSAGISYDVNQPHIDFQRYALLTKADTTRSDSPYIIVSTKRDTIYVEHKFDTTSYTETIIQTHVTRDTLPALHYQPIEFLQVWRSTILTTLTQESADLLAFATVHNKAMVSTNVSLDKEKSDLFEWILIFHIIISWIFFGVFISLLYNKFRYES